MVSWFSSLLRTDIFHLHRFFVFCKQPWVGRNRFYWSVAFQMLVSEVSFRKWEGEALLGWLVPFGEGSGLLESLSHSQAWITNIRMEQSCWQRLALDCLQGMGRGEQPSGMRDSALQTFSMGVGGCRNPPPLKQTWCNIGDAFIVPTCY